MLGFIDFNELIRKIEEWITGHSGRDDDDRGDLTPVLLIPGIGASILHAVDEHNHGERVWVRVLLADREFRRKLWSKYDPATGKTLSLDPKTHIEVPKDNYGLYSCDYLDPAMVIRLNVLCNFHDIIQQLVQWGYSEGTSLFGFGYDFRQSNRLPEAVNALKCKLEEIHKTSGGKKVNIISHSMGGLLVKSLLGLHSNEFEKLVNSWTTISTPFQGAPAYITDCLLTGVEFLKGWQKEFWVAKWSTHQLLVECPAVYEMMASLTHKWERIPQLRIWKKRDCGAELCSYGPLDSVSVMEEALKNNTLCFDCRSIPIPFSRDILLWSNESRELWRNAKLPEGFKFYNIYGTSCDTPFDVCYGSEEAPIDELQELLDTEADFTYVDGDGTVPSESSRADGLHATARHGIPGDHRGLLRSQELFELIRGILKVGKKENVQLQAGVTRCEQVIERVSEICIPMKTGRKSWDTISEDSEDYSSSTAAECETTVVVGTSSASAQAQGSCTTHDDVHDELEPGHARVSIVGICEGLEAGTMNEVLEHAMSLAMDSLKEKLAVL